MILVKTTKDGRMIELKGNKQILEAGDFNAYMGKKLSDLSDIYPESIIELNEKVMYHANKKGLCKVEYNVSGLQKTAFCYDKNNHFLWFVYESKRYNLIKKVGHRELNKIMNTYLIDERIPLLI